MRKYIEVKIVKARPMNRAEYNIYREWELPADENGADEGMLVEYPLSPDNPPNNPDHKGYISWSPLGVFVQANAPVDGMPFGHAIEAAKQGKKIARAGWNGKDMFVYLVDGSRVGSDQLRGACAKHINPLIIEDGMVDICPHLDMMAADGSIVIGWIPSQVDLLADDYYIVD